MQSYILTDLIKEVRVALDENEVSTALIAANDTDTLSLDRIIRQKLLDAALMITRNTTSDMLDGGIDFPDINKTITWHEGSEYNWGYLTLPSDFLRLVIFKMDDWLRPVTDPIYDYQQEYFLQKSKFSGIHGNVEKPVCAITTYPAGRTMEIFSCRPSDNASIFVAKYIPEPSISGTPEALSIPSKLKPAVIYYAAGLTAEDYKDENHAQVLIQIGLTLAKIQSATTK